MTVDTSRFGFQWNYASHDSGWGTGYNYAMRALAALLDCYLVSDTVTDPPGSPVENDAYLVPAVATGDWAINTGKIAAYQGGAWQYYTPERGLRAYIASRSNFYWFNGTTWGVVSAGGGSGGVLTVAGHSPDLSGNVSLVVGDISGAAPLSSPAFTGTPTAPNATALSRNTQVANTKYVDDAVRTAVTGGTTFDWSQLPAEAQQTPAAFVIPGKPAAAQVYNIVIVQALTLPANFAGAAVYAGTLPTASAAFTVKKISAGSTATIGTITKTTASAASSSLSTQAQVSFAAGDVLQLVAPSPQDATMADLGVTLLLNKV